MLPGGRRTEERDSIGWVTGVIGSNILRSGRYAGKVHLQISGVGARSSSGPSGEG